MERRDLVSVVYLGHHYVVDVVGGIVFAVGAYTVLKHPWLASMAKWISNKARRGALEPAGG